MHLAKARTFLRRGIQLGSAAAAMAAAMVSASEGTITGTPLAVRAPQRTPTLFTAVSADESGIRMENRYADPRMWGQLYQEFEGGSIGTGVAIGDYDGDGRSDIFTVSKTESCRLFRNLGNFKFDDVSEKAGVADLGAAAAIWKQGATFVDVNNDGRLDLYVCRFDAPNLLYLNQGDGTFKETAQAAGLDVRDASVMACFCDYDRDGWLDVYIVVNMLNSVTHPNGQRGRLFHNRGDGTFTEVTEPAGLTGEAQSHSASWWDYDNDGWPDLYVANDYGAPDKLFHNNGDGTFTNTMDEVVPHTAHYSMGSDTADVNGDGRIDLIVADMAATTHQRDHDTIAEARDKSDDLAFVKTAAKYRRSALLLNTGTGRCLEAGVLAGIYASDWTWSPRFADFDNDGRVDYFVTNGFNRDPSPDMHQRSMKAESTEERIRILRATPVLRQTNLAFRNLGDLEFEDVAHAWGLDDLGVSFAAATGDLAGDGNLDLVYSNYEANVTLMRNHCDRGHRVTIHLHGTASNRFGIGSVVKVETAAGTQRAQLWLARGYMASSEPALHFGLGDETVIRRLTVSWPSGHLQVFDHVAADQRIDITEPSRPAPPLVRDPPAPPRGQFTEISQSVGLSVASREEVVEEGAQQRTLPFRLNRRGPALAVAPLGPGSDEAVVVGGTTASPLRVLHRSAPGAFARTATTLGTGTEINDGPLLLFDASGDGLTDLLVTKGGNSLPPGLAEYQPRLFLGDGHGGFAPAPDDALPSVTVSVGAAATADFDRDGHLDLFLGGRVLTGDYPQSPPSALLANRGGKFEDVTDILAPALRNAGMVTGALWSDVDVDGWPDLLVTTDWGPVRYFHNEEGKRFEDRTDSAGFAAAGTGWWTGITGADFNEDGRMDYVVGNTGLNTMYHADPGHPALLYAGDFKGDGTVQLIEALHEGDRIYPWRTRSYLAKSIPWLMKKFPLNSSFARATLGEIFGEDRLAAAQRYAVTELRSGVFLSQPDGTFRFEPLPRLAQISPLQGLVAADLDGDGHADVYSVQNYYGPSAPIGRFDSGLSQLLRGDGQGHFTAVAVADSMLVVPGDAKAAVLLDVNDDGWPEIVVSRNDDTTLAFRNDRVPRHNSLRVALHGPGGNPTGVGARVSLESADGSRQTAEVYAGSGYYSQSSPYCFFGYTEGHPPKTVHVRWPDGSTTIQPVPAGATKLVISAASP